LIQKEASALRDDILIHYNRLFEHYREKLELLETIRKSDTDKRYTLKSGTTEKLVELIDRDNDLFGRINCIDADIAETKRVLCGIIGIEIPMFDNFFMTNTGQDSIELRKIIIRIVELINEIIEERNSLMKDMTDKRDSIKSDIDALTVKKKFKI
jgi:hypothetical protein